MQNPTYMLAIMLSLLQLIIHAHGSIVPGEEENRTSLVYLNLILFSLELLSKRCWSRPIPHNKLFIRCKLTVASFRPVLAMAIVANSGRKSGEENREVQSSPKTALQSYDPKILNELLKQWPEGASKSNVMPRSTRRFINDSVATFHLISINDLTAKEKKRIRKLA